MKTTFFLLASILLFVNGWKTTTGSVSSTGTTGPGGFIPCASTSNPELTCNSTFETCTIGYHSSVCCDASEGFRGCCGVNNMYSVGGCKCAAANSTCCGDLTNTICGPDTCCCSDGTTAVCCTGGTSCCITAAMGGQCCTSDQLCSRRYGCFQPSVTIPLDYYRDVINTTLCEPVRNNTNITTTTSGPGASSSTTSSSTCGGTSTTGESTGPGGVVTPIRKVIVENRGYLFKVTSTIIGTVQLDNFDAIFQQFEGDAGMFEVYFSYFTEIENMITILDYKIRFFSIIEFVESGAHPGYQPWEDTLVQRYTLSNETWNPFTGPFYNGDLITFDGTTSLGTIDLSGYVSDHIVPLPKSNNDLNPDQVKFDINVNFTSLYLRSDTYIALESRIKTFTKISQGDGFITFFGNKSAHANFDWVPFATTPSGESISVLPSPLVRYPNPVEPEYTIYFTFDTSAHVPFFWDPSVGVVRPARSTVTTSPTDKGVSSTSTTIMPYLFLLLACTLLLG